VQFPPLGGLELGFQERSRFEWFIRSHRSVRDIFLRSQWWIVESLWTRYPWRLLILHQTDKRWQKERFFRLGGTFDDPSAPRTINVATIIVLTGNTKITTWRMTVQDHNIDDDMDT
jgi:hypothetical protein